MQQVVPNPRRPEPLAELAERRNVPVGLDVRLPFRELAGGGAKLVSGDLLVTADTVLIEPRGRLPRTGVTAMTFELADQRFPTCGVSGLESRGDHRGGIAARPESD
jgi:hypothetical protein